MKKRAIPAVLFVCLAVFMLFDLNALAAETKASEYLKRYSANITKTQDGDLTVSCSVTGVKEMDSIGVSKIVIQQHNGSRWTTEETYTVADLPDLQASNAAYLRGEFTHMPESSGFYRALVTVYAEDGNGSDSEVVTTVSIKI